MEGSTVALRRTGFTTQADRWSVRNLGVIGPVFIHASMMALIRISKFRCCFRIRAAQYSVVQRLPSGPYSSISPAIISLSTPSKDGIPPPAFGVTQCPPVVTALAKTGCLWGSTSSRP